MERADLLYSGLMFAAACCRSGPLCCSRPRFLLLFQGLSHRGETAYPRLLQFHLREIALRWIASPRIMVPKKLRPLVPYVKRYRSSFLWGGVCVLLNNGVWVLFPQVLRRAVNDLHSGVTRQKLLTYSLLIVAIALIKGVFQF